MPFKNLTTSSMLSLMQYPDIDSFRISERYARAQSIPTKAGNHSVLRACLKLSSCSLSLVRTFPRIIKGYEIPGRLLVVIPMDDISSARINGISIGQSLLMMSGSANYTVCEPEGRQVAILSIPKVALTGDLASLEDSYLLLELPGESLEAFRRLILRLLESAAHEAQSMQTQAEQQEAERLLLAELDDAVRVGRMTSGSELRLQSRHHMIVEKIDDMLRFNPAAKMDSRVLAETMGVSMRTLQNATQNVCGTSTLRYLRLRRLWMVRDQLRSGATGLTVAASAQAHGFHHMGEFSALYRTTFGEMPSTTLAEGRCATSGQGRSKKAG